jgi:Domain of unknown function (DUF1918)
MRVGFCVPLWQSKLPRKHQQRGVKMAFQVGERVVVESESTNRPPRMGVIEEVLRGDPSPRYRIRWDDGHESTYSPADGALRAGRARTRPSGARSRERSSRAGAERASASEDPGARKRKSASEPQPDELAQYYRDEEEHIHLLE